MNFFAARVRVYNRGVISDAFLTELVEWGKTAPDDIFERNNNFDIYNKCADELGPFIDPPYRRAALLHIMSVLAWFESSGNWDEGIDLSRSSDTTSENAEAGMWQVSWDSRKLDQSLDALLAFHDITNGIAFQLAMKRNHKLAMEYAARLLRIDVKNYERIMNGPVRKGDERKKTWPNRPKLWLAEQSIYPWLSRAAVDELKGLLK